VNGGAAGPFFNSFSLKEKFNSGFNAGGRLGLQYGPIRVEEEYKLPAQRDFEFRRVHRWQYQQSV